jgi:hydrogenase nickel incorporation protein HypA/HybF
LRNDVHELALTNSIVEIVERYAARRRVTKVVVTIGALRQVVPGSLRFYFGMVSRDTVCDGAVLILNVASARARCEACQAEWKLELPLFLCPECGGAGRPVTGEEFEVESIEVVEVEEKEAANASH